MTFSERLMDMRKERGYTQYSLAEAVGVSVGVLVGEEERIVIQRGGMRLELPDTPEGRSLAEARLREFSAGEIARGESGRAG